MNRQISQVESIARNCDPPVLITIESEEFEKKTFLVVSVSDSAQRPHSCSDGFFLRSGATSQKMTRDEIVEFLYSSGQVKWDEKTCPKFSYPRDFDEKAFDYFLEKAKITKKGVTTEDLLENLGLARRDEGRLIFNNAGVLFFAKEPIRFISEATVDCILFMGSEKLNVLDRKEMKGNLIYNVEKAMIFLEKHLSLRYEIKGLYRNEILEIPQDALREALLNAVMHRKYHSSTSWTSIEIFRDRVEISDPGGLPPGMNMKDIRSILILRMCEAS